MSDTADFEKDEKRTFLSHLYSFLHGVRIGGILSNNRHHRISDPVIFMKKSCICICRPGGVLYSVDNLLTAHRRMLCLTASHSSASHTHIMDGLLLYLALLCK